jgi:hypothetical protein
MCNLYELYVSINTAAWAAGSGATVRADALLLLLRTTLCRDRQLVRVASNR